MADHLAREQVERLFTETRDWSQDAMRDVVQRLHDTALHLFDENDDLRAASLVLLDRPCCKARAYPCPHDEDYPPGFGA